ncbi:MAG: undecaprenyl-diphosphate phosphatase [Acidimicrobiales bacterium]
MSRRVRGVLAAVLVTIVVGLAWAGTATAGGAADPATATAAPDASEPKMTIAQAAILGVVEGVTEYLPVSSTGHLLVTQRLMDIGTTEADKTAADAYAVVIQLGAILAIVILYWSRLMSLVRGLVGRDAEGRRVLIGVVVAFVPAAVIGVAGESTIKDVLFGAWPVVAAWFVGGVALLIMVRVGILPTGDGDEPLSTDEDDAADMMESIIVADDDPGRQKRTRVALGMITPQQALIIGLAQCLAMWPGTSRSLVTIVAAVLVGLRLSAAVEFSFLLGLGTLSAATMLDLAKHGGEIVDTFGVAAPVVGFVAALVSAVVAVRWMVTYLQRHSLAIFGWYRIGVALLVGVLLVTGTITSAA